MMWSRERMKYPAVAMAAALAAAVCGPRDKPAADSARTPTTDAVSIPASAADGAGLHRAGVGRGQEGRK